MVGEPYDKLEEGVEGSNAPSWGDALAHSSRRLRAPWW